MTGRLRLVLLRHGQSEWNAAGIFTGWENAHMLRMRRNLRMSYLPASSARPVIPTTRQAPPSVPFP